MTAIVGISHNSCVWIGGDSAGVGQNLVQSRVDPKVFTVGEFLIGYTTSFRMGQLLEHHLAPPKAAKGVDCMSYMVTQFVPAVKDCLKDGGFEWTDHGRTSGGVFLVGWRGQLYRIDSDYQVGRMADGYTAVGCGEELALGSLHTTHGYEISPRERVLKALQAAEAFSTSVQGPFTVRSKR